MKRILSMAVVAVLAFCLISCPGSGTAERGSLRVEVGRTTRTIAPPYDMVKVVGYALQGRNSTTGTTINQKFTGNRLTINDMEVGKWSLRVAGYNEARFEVASSPYQDVTIESSLQTAARFDVSYPTDGEGQFEIEVKGPLSDPDFRGVSVSIWRSPGHNSFPCDKEWRLGLENMDEMGDIRIFMDTLMVPAGNWDIVFQVLDGNGDPVGKPYNESLHIYPVAPVRLELPWADGMFRKAAAPVFDLDPGTVHVEGTKLSMKTPDGSKIYYTKDGSDPAANGSLCSGLISLDHSMTVRAVAKKDGLMRSEITDGNFRVKASPVAFSVPAGIKHAPFDLTMTTSSIAGEIWYTTDGTDPSPENGTKYSSSIRIETPMTVKARVWKTGQEVEPSDIMEAKYDFDRQNGNFEITVPVEHVLSVKDGTGNPIGPVVDLSLVDRLVASVSPDSSPSFDWYLDGELVCQGDTVTIGRSGKEINISSDMAMISVKAYWPHESLTENMALTFK